MSTNFYFRIKAEMNIFISIDGKIREKIMEKLKWTLDEATEIHIGKRSVGWYPLFEKTEYYSSVKEIKEFYESNKKHLDIIDEYSNEYSIEQLQEELFDWNKDNLEARSHSDLGHGYYLDREGYEFTRDGFS